MPNPKFQNYIQGLEIAIDTEKRYKAETDLQKDQKSYTLRCLELRLEGAKTQREEMKVYLFSTLGVEWPEPVKIPDA